VSTLPFEEHQRFRQPFLWVILLVGFAAVLATVLVVPHAGPAGWTGAGLFFGVCLLFYVMDLCVVVDDEAVRIQFFPLWKKTLRLEEIAQWEARSYRPVLEYGGWGIRYGGSSGWAYNVRGNRGVQLVLEDGKRILIGSQRAEELAWAISEAKGQPAGRTPSASS
jgi:hypothetical protein